MEVDASLLSSRRAGAGEGLKGEGASGKGEDGGGESDEETDIGELEEWEGVGPSKS